jgi:dihydrofolate synthase/folylpolyglutamate synthase
VLDWLYQQFPSYQKIGSKAYKPTLENTKEILKFIGNPEKELKFIHVAGSNGKGSVCSLVASVLTEAGYKVGLFTSPHIVDFTERIRVNGKQMEIDSVNEFIKRIREHKFPFSPSFFEITFGMALDYFKAQDCDICIIETGLGGRLDATNVITPEISAITSISLEHTDILGSTIEAIAKEKAGIIKKGKPVVIGKLETEALFAIKEKASIEKSEIILATSNNEYDNHFIAGYQKDNLKTALSVLDRFDSTIDHDSILRGIQNLSNNTGYSGRLQIVAQKPITIFDVSHNTDGIAKTISAIESINQGNLHIIYGTSADKDIKKIAALLPNKAHYYLTEFSNPRSASIDSLKKNFTGKDLESISYFEKANEAMKSAQSNCNENDTLLVIGSFFLLSDFF